MVCGSAHSNLNSRGLVTFSEAAVKARQQLIAYCRSIQQPGRRAGLGNLPYLVQKTCTDRDPFAHALCSVVPLRVARDHDRLGGIDGLCCPQVAAQAGHVGGEFLAVAEQARIDRDQISADIAGAAHGQLSMGTSALTPISVVR